jgi:hypothetical protein
VTKALSLKSAYPRLRAKSCVILLLLLALYAPAWGEDTEYEDFDFHTLGIEAGPEQMVTIARFSVTTESIPGTMR